SASASTPRRTTAMRRSSTWRCRCARPSTTSVSHWHPRCLLRRWPEMEQSFFTVRPATQADLASLVELRAYLLDDTNASYSSKTPEDAARWRAAYRTWLNSRLNDSDCVQILTAEHR